MIQADVSMNALAERCFRIGANRQLRKSKNVLYRSRGNSKWRRRKATGWCLLGLGLFGLWSAIGVSGFFWLLLLTAGAASLFYAILDRGPELQQRRKILASVKQGVAAYERGESWAVARVHQYAVEEFRNRVAAHRERTLGDRSEWGLARASLMEATSEAQRSAAYWRARLRQEPDNEFAKSQQAVSERLEAKLVEASGKLDARSAALLKFYNECDARLAAMDRRNRDLEEFRRLEDLSGRADMVIAHAEGTIDALATAFVMEARAFADALGGVATVGIKSLAGEAPMDNIDYFADRIIEDSDRDRAAIEDLERRLAR